MFRIIGVSKKTEE